MAPKLSVRLLEMGTPAEEFNVVCNTNAQPDTDPLPIHIEFKPVAGASAYLADKVILEVGARSLMEPAESRLIQSFVADIYEDEDFAGKPFEVSTVLPARTFLEKIFLIHEQFLSNEQAPLRNRMSRHLYDIEKLMDTGHAANALNDEQLFGHIVAHRKEFTPIRGITYDKHIPSAINILPPPEVIALWEKDYSEFIEHMVVGKRLKFDELITRISQLQEQIRKVNWLAAHPDYLWGNNGGDQKITTIWFSTNDKSILPQKSENSLSRFLSDFYREGMIVDNAIDCKNEMPSINYGLPLYQYRTRKVLSPVDGIGLV